MNSWIPAEIPMSLKQYHGMTFRDGFKTDFLIEVHEQDFSRLRLKGCGTTFDPSLEPTFEFRVYEVDDLGYKGLSGQFINISDVQDFYRVKLF